MFLPTFHFLFHLFAGDLCLSKLWAMVAWYLIPFNSNFKLQIIKIKKVFGISNYLHFICVFSLHFQKMFLILDVKHHRNCQHSTYSSILCWLTTRCSQKNWMLLLLLQVVTSSFFWDTLYLLVLSLMKIIDLDRRPQEQ